MPAAGKTCPNGHRMRELQSRCGACGWTDGDLGAAGPDSGSWPENCMVDGCHEKTTIPFVLATKGNQTHMCRPATVLDRNGSIRQGWTFVGWYTRCALHYLRELDGMDKSRFKSVDRELEAHRERMQRESEERAQARIVSGDQERGLLEEARHKFAGLNEAAA